MMVDPKRFQAAIDRFDEANRQDPNRESSAGKTYAKELLYAKQHDEEKLLNILRKTWNKMSPRGHEAALQLTLPTAARTLIEKALQAG